MGPSKRPRLCGGIPGSSTCASEHSSTAQTPPWSPSSSSSTTRRFCRFQCGTTASKASKTPATPALNAQATLRPPPARHGSARLSTATFPPTKEAPVRPEVSPRLFRRDDRIWTCDPLTSRRPNGSIRAKKRIFPRLRSCGTRHEMHGLHGSGPLLVPPPFADGSSAADDRSRGHDRHPDFEAC